jgi:hypothetical protein
MIKDNLAVSLIGYKDAILRNYESRYENPNGERFGIEFNEGNKYVKVVSVSWGSRSVHSFIDKATGDIWRAASWKSPARNFARGNVFKPDSYLNRLAWTGVV